MTTYLLLALTDDGRVADLYEYDRSELLNFREKMPIAESASGNDRGEFVTYEVAGYSIDVVRLPK